MFSDCGDCKSTVQRVESQENAQDQGANNSLFLQTMLDAGKNASASVSRTAFELPPVFSQGMPPALNDLPKWQSPTAPAMNDIPTWQNQTQPAMDDRPNWQRRTDSFPNQGDTTTPPWQNPVPPVLGNQPPWLNPTPPVFNGGAGSNGGLGDGGFNSRPGIPDAPSMGDPWKSSWGDNAPGSQFNPAPAPVDSGKPWRAGWGDVAPGFPSTPPEPAPDSGKPWRAGWGDVANGFPRNPQEPPADNNNSGTPWRAGWGDVASGFPGNPGQPTQNPGWRQNWGDTTPTGFQLPQAPGQQAPGQIDRTSFGNQSGTSPWGTSSPWGAPQDLPTPSPSQGGAPFRPAPTPAPTRVDDTSSGSFFPSPTQNDTGSSGPGDFFPPVPGSGSDNNGGQPPAGGDSPAPTGDPSQLKIAAEAALAQDLANPSQFNFERTVGLMKQLGQASETALELEMRDWLGKQKSMSPLTFMRGAAEISEGLGEFRLGAGSRIDKTSHQDTKPRILQGVNYDFGGEANLFLRMAAGNLVNAQQYVAGHKGQVIDGQVMNDAYIQQLRNLQTDSERNLNTIYGAHDVNKVFSTIRSQVNANATMGDWQQGLVHLQHDLDGSRSTDSRFIAKSARDVAIGYLAEADYMASQDNGEDAKIMYQSATKYLSLSMQRDSNAPDNVAIQRIAQGMAQKINGAIDNQWKDPFGNPFNIPKPANDWVGV